jgi:hypothetical protein
LSRGYECPLSSEAVEIVLGLFQIDSRHFQLFFKLLLGRAGGIDSFVHLPRDEFLYMSVDDIAGKSGIRATEIQGNDRGVPFRRYLQICRKLLLHHIFRLQAGEFRVQFFFALEGKQVLSFSPLPDDAFFMARFFGRGIESGFSSV